jgi:DNA repair protein RecO (recombination protein O)
MAIVTSKAIVLHYFRYQDNSIIAKALTEDFGVQSFVIKGVNGKKSNKKALISSVNILEISFRHNESSDLQFSREIQILKPFHNLNVDVYKNATVLFIRELLYKVLREDYQEMRVYYLLDEFLRALEIAEKVGMIHLDFMLNLTEILGVSPQGQASNELPCFSLVEGKFVSKTEQTVNVIEGQTSRNFSDYINGVDRLFSQTEKRELLDVFVRYFKAQLDYVKEIHSHEVFKEVFG